MSMDRRSFLRVSAVSAAGMLLRIDPLKGKESAEDPTESTEPLKPKQLKRDGARPETWITPNETFYIQSIDETPPIKEEKARFTLTGMVEKERRYHLNDLKEMTPVKEYRTLSCIGDPVGGRQIGNAEWTAVRLRDLLKEAKPIPEAKRVVFSCADGYITSFPLKDALDKNMLLAYEMNGVQLPPDHGYPVRLLNPGKYGQKCPKWIVSIQLVKTEHRGFYEKRGWSDVAAVRTATRVGLPSRLDRLPAGKYKISGSAFDGGNHGGIEKVEVSVDSGATWNDAAIWASASPLTWSLWEYEWEVGSALKYARILARAVTRDGKTQTDKVEHAGPEGATGYHTVEVRIES